MPNLSMHIFDAGERREAKAVEFLLRLPIATAALCQTMGISGVPWFALRVPTDLLVADEELREDLPGDVDLIAGGLRPGPTFEKHHAEIAERWGEAHPSRWTEVSLLQTPPVWPPDLKHLVAAEFKASYLSRDGTLKATGSGSLDHTYAQASGLARMGFSRVHLNWMVATAPVSVEGTNTANFFEASARAHDGQLGVVRFLRSDPTQAFGQWVFASGSVPWASETHTGTFSSPKCIRPAPLLDVQSDLRVRDGVRSWLEGVFSACTVPPATISLFIRVCSSRRCRRGFLAGPEVGARCPSCSSAAT